MRRIFSHPCLAAVFWLLLLSVLPPEASARTDRELVDCRYLKASGTEIALQISVGSPPPSTLIITQKVPAGSTIAAASPMYNKYNAQRGEAKWLLKGVNPGVFVLSIRLEQPVQSGEIGGEISYKNPASGQMVSMSVRP